MGTEAQDEIGGVATSPVAIGDKYIVGLKLCTVEKIHRTGHVVLSGVDGRWRVSRSVDTMSRAGEYSRWTENTANRATPGRLVDWRRRVLVRRAENALMSYSNNILLIARGKDDDAKIAEAVRLGLIPQTHDKEAVE